jgi:FemAB-related protein (PEP-CTERM system-associated)
MKVTTEKAPPPRSNADLKTRIKSLQAEKGQVARQFKQPELTEETREALKQAMQAVSKALGQAQAELKAQLNPPDEQPAEAPPLPGFLQPATENLGLLVTVRPLSPSETGQWADFVQHHPRAAAYHHPAYPEHIKTVFGHNSLVLAAFDEGTLVGGLPVTLMRSRLFGEFGVSVPYFNYGGPLTHYQDVMEALLTEARSLLDTEKADHLEIRTTQPGLSAPCSTRKVSMVLSLPKTEPELDAQLGSKVRAQYKKAEEYKPDIRFGGLELLDDFYRVFAINMRDLGTPVYSKGWFKSLLEDEQLTTYLAVGYLQGKAVSTGFLLGHRDLLEIPWASTLRSANSTNMNMWMYRQILGYALGKGYRHFDFGRSTLGAGTYAFKKQWGAMPVPHYWYSLNNGDQPIAEANPDNPKYRLIIAVWQRLPVWLTRLIGPYVIKNVP